MQKLKPVNVMEFSFTLDSLFNEMLLCMCLNISTKNSSLLINEVILGTVLFMSHFNRPFLNSFKQTLK